MARLMFRRRARRHAGARIAVCVIVLALVAVASCRAHAQGPGFVSAQGTGLQLDGRPWSAVGFNDYRVMSIDSSTYICGGAHSDTQVATEFQEMANLGSNTIRTWFYQAYAVDPARGSVSYWAPFDRVLNDAAASGMKVIATLADQWGSCENYDWQPNTYKTLSWYQGGYATTRYNGLPLTYRQWVQAWSHATRVTSASLSGS
jgi:hypothetical protein